MSVYVSLVRLAIPLNYTSEFRELLKLLRIISKCKVIIPVHAMKAKAEVEKQLRSFLNLAVDVGESSASCDRPLYSRRKSFRCLQNRRLGGP
jgi:hypothetical protein